MAKQGQHGVTLVEMATALCICGISVTAASGGLSSMLVKHRLEGVSAELATDLRFARSEAVARNSRVLITFFSNEQSSCYVIYTGAQDGCSCDGSGVTTCSAGAEELKTQRLTHDRRVRLIKQGITNYVGFDPTNGMVTPTLTAHAVADDRRTIKTIVNIMGRVKHCTPRDASERVPGYPTCLS